MQFSRSEKKTNKTRDLNSALPYYTDRRYCQFIYKPVLSARSGNVAYWHRYSSGLYYVNYQSVAASVAVLLAQLVFPGNLSPPLGGRQSSLVDGSLVTASGAVCECASCGATICRSACKHDCSQCCRCCIYFEIRVGRSDLIDDDDEDDDDDSGVSSFGGGGGHERQQLQSTSRYGQLQQLLSRRRRQFHYADNELGGDRSSGNSSLTTTTASGDMMMQGSRRAEGGGGRKRPGYETCVYLAYE